MTVRAFSHRTINQVWKGSKMSQSKIQPKINTIDLNTPAKFGAKRTLMIIAIIIFGIGFFVMVPNNKIEPTKTQVLDWDHKQVISEMYSQAAKIENRSYQGLHIGQLMQIDSTTYVAQHRYLSDGEKCRDRVLFTTNGRIKKIQPIY
jgi:hypothetical protein